MPRVRAKQDDHWKQVVRDAFIDGRDDDAIDLLLSNIVGWIADQQERRMMVEDDIASISHNQRVGVYKLVTIRTKRIVGTLE